MKRITKQQIPNEQLPLIEIKHINEEVIINFTQQQSVGDKFSVSSLEKIIRGNKDLELLFRLGTNSTRKISIINNGDKMKIIDIKKFKNSLLFIKLITNVLNRDVVISSLVSTVLGNYFENIEPLNNIFEFQDIRDE